MPRAVLLACPVCDAVLAIRGKRADVSKRSLRATARDHLVEHDLTEPKAAIRKHATAANAVEVIVSPEEYRRLPVDEWTDRDAAGIRDDAMALRGDGAVGGREFGNDGVGSLPDRTTDTASPRSASREGPSQ